MTDPYLPLEKRLSLTRDILSVLVEHQPRLVIQTRGPLVVRDLDLLKQFKSVRVNVSIPTDSESVRMLFEPKAPPLEKRWEAIREIRSAGVAVGICVTPTLPLENIESFAQKLTDFRPDVLVCQEFHNAGGRFGADTGVAARHVLSTLSWGPADYERFFNRLRRDMVVFDGETGFFPPPI